MPGVPEPTPSESSQRQFFDKAGPLFGVVVSPAASTTPLNETRKFRALGTIENGFLTPLKEVGCSCPPHASHFRRLLVARGDRPGDRRGTGGIHRLV